VSDSARSGAAGHPLPPAAPVVEYLDVVDEDDRVTGRDTRTNVHANYLIHRGVHVFVINRERKVLVQRRALQKVDYPGYLDVSVGAQVSAGESYDAAARRELHEEIGCEDASIFEIGAYDGFSVRQREKRRVYIHYCDGPFRPDPAEVADISFHTVDEISHMIDVEQFTGGFRRSFALLLASRWSPAGTDSPDVP
jgi:isopentenyldiphosphate isomerase